jgi:hypothetical protein
MTVNEIVDELRGSRPQASEALRAPGADARVRTARGGALLRERLRGRRRLLLALRPRPVWPSPPRSR